MLRQRRADMPKARPPFWLQAQQLRKIDWFNFAIVSTGRQGLLLIFKQGTGGQGDDRDAPQRAALDDARGLITVHVWAPKRNSGRSPTTPVRARAHPGSPRLG